MSGMCKPNKPFPPHAASGHSVNLSNRKQTRAVRVKDTPLCGGGENIEYTVELPTFSLFFSLRLNVASTLEMYEWMRFIGHDLFV